MRHKPAYIIFNLLLVLLFSQAKVFAQEKCGLVPYMKNLKEKNHVEQTEQEFEQWIAKKIFARKSGFRIQSATAAPYKIPVVVHIIHNGEAIGSGTNISDEQVLSQIDVLNKDFRRLNIDATNTPSWFLPFASSIDVEFILAKRTPEGLPTSGIVRTNGGRSSWTSTRDVNNNNIEDFKELSYWPAQDYLNIWVLNITDYLGYAQFPISNLEGLGSFQDGIAETDGVVIAYDVFGSVDDGPFNLDTRYNKGRTLTHEVGHYFGLRHIWGDDSGCSNSDYVNDTPNQGGPTSNACPNGVRMDGCSTSAPGIMYQNYMDYTNDACMNLFTTGQVNRMAIIFEDSNVPRRRSLWETSQGLDDPVCGPSPPVDIAINQLLNPGLITCDASPETSIVVQNLSCPTITSVKIDYQVNGNNLSKIFTGLSINPLATATLNLGEINLSPGQNTLTIYAALVNGEIDSNPNNSDTTITIFNDTQKDIIPLRENFNNNSLNNWSVVNPQNGIVWDLEGINTQYAARFPIQSNSQPNAIAWLASPVLNLESIPQASLFFDLDYQWDGSSNDRLQILASTDCGNTYSDIFDAQGENLFGKASTGSRIYQNLSTFVGNDQVRIAFVATSAQGKNIYLDNIEFYISENSDPLEISELFSIYRTGTSSTITFNLSERSDIGFAVLDVTGRTIIDAKFEDTLNQTYSLQTALPNGLYIIRLSISGRNYSTKVYFTE